MRDILFRGKRVDNGEWVYGFYAPYRTIVKTVQHRIYTGEADKVDGQLDFYPDFYPDFYNVIPETVGQYTGLKDKNNVKAFEGDIVKVYDVYCNETVVGVVEFCDGSFRIYDKDFTSYDRWMYGKVEVIGNVYDGGAYD